MNRLRPNSARPADDQDGVSRIRAMPVDAQSFIKGLPRRNRHQGISRSVGKGKAPWLPGDNALIDELLLGIGTRACDISGVIDLVSGLKSLSPGTRPSSTMPAASQPRITPSTFATLARTFDPQGDRHRLDPDEQVATDAPGLGRSTSTKESGSNAAKGRVVTIAFIR